jgi:hypothetical protein
LEEQPDQPPYPAEDGWSEADEDFVSARLLPNLARGLQFLSAAALALPTIAIAWPASATNPTTGFYGGGSVVESLSGFDIANGKADAVPHSEILFACALLIVGVAVSFVLSRRRAALAGLLASFLALALLAWPIAHLYFYGIATRMRNPDMLFHPAEIVDAVAPVSLAAGSWVSAAALLGAMALWGIVENAERPWTH